LARIVKKAFVCNLNIIHLWFKHFHRLLCSWTMATTVERVCHSRYILSWRALKTLKPETVHVQSCLESPSKQHSLRK